MSQHLGASAADWDHWDLVLGVGSDLLPVVPDPLATPSLNSKVKAFGKIPSVYDREDYAVGLAKWTERVITPQDIARWRADPRLGMCVRSSAVRAIDVDVDDPVMSIAILRVIEQAFGGHTPPRRVRSNSRKFLVPFVMAEPLRKQIITTPLGRIEILGDGQQFVVAGTHPSGARYEWSPECTALPEMTREHLDALIAELEREFGVQETRASTEREQRTDVNESLLTTIDDATLADLKDALAWPPLVEAAGDNSTWSEIGYALLSIRHTGRELFVSFSTRAPNYEPNAPLEWWKTHEQQSPRSDYRHVFTMARRLGWRSTAGADAFPTVDTPVGEPPADVEPLPQAHHLCTDLKNAHRLRDAFGHMRLIVVGGTFYAWTGTHWRRDDNEATRCAAKLSSMVRDEIKGWREQRKALIEAADEETRKRIAEVTTYLRKDQSAKVRELQADSKIGAAIMKAGATIAALSAWSKKCEMSGTISAAVSLLRSMITIDVDLDRDRMLINCQNGTIDVRTGLLRPHDPKDYITRCAPVNYNPDARCDRFELFMSEIMAGDEERVSFLKRWFGYAMTGDVREQKILLHIGKGSNGKSTLIELLESIYGSYAHTGAEGLLTVSAGDRHPTEIADLAGRRLVTVHETESGAVLREGLLKQATGGDRLTGRFLFKDFFEFAPTHKLQLLTNHTPVVRGQDHAIWRRLLLVKYNVIYGTDEEIEAGKAQLPQDTALPITLRGESEGIFAWIVAGAREWLEQGLKPPKSVLDESEAYRAEQDRVAEFVRERCIVGKDEWTDYNGPLGIYPQYTRWCKDSGYHALGIKGFTNELCRVVRGAETVERKQTVNGVRKTVRGTFGVRVNMDDDGGGFAVTNDNEDLL